MRLRTLIIVLLPFVVPPALSAQQLSLIQPGTRIRVTSPSCGLNKQVATLEMSRSDTLVLGSEISTAQCSLDDITRLDVDGGRKVSAARAVGFPLAGFLVGGVTGGLIGYATCAPCNYELEGLAPVFGTALGGAVGFVAGLVVGLLPRDSWAEIPLERMRVSVAPRQIGFSPGLSVSLYIP